MANSFSKFSNHQNHYQTSSAQTQAQIMAIHRNNKQTVVSKFPAGMSIEEQINSHVMPEIAESVMSQEEEDEFKYTPHMTF